MDRVRRQRIRLDMLVAEAGGTDELLASRLGTAASYISQLRTNRSGISRKFCDRLEKKMGKPDGWMDQWLPEEIDEPPAKRRKAKQTVFEADDLSDAETRLLAMWRTWGDDVKRYAFGQMLIVAYTKDVLARMFVTDGKKRFTAEDLNKFATEMLSKTGRLRKKPEVGP